MRVAIASRIFEPEPSAASFRLKALAESFSDAGDEVIVLTVRPRHAQRGTEPSAYRVKRFPVLRDRSGYVRGYLQYLSFDIPLFFRVLFGPRYDALVIEPPPTTVFFGTIAAKLRGIPTFAYAADVWSDASESADAPGFVVRAVRRMERFGWNAARGVLSVNEGVSERVLSIAPRSRVETVGNGIDTEVFRPDGPVLGNGAFAIYTGTASEWQGAEVFVEAIAQLKRRGSKLRLVFLGQGTAWPELCSLAERIDAPVEFVSSVPPQQAAAWLRGASLSLASIKPGAGYDFAFPTKVFAAWGCGVPVVYAGPGPARSVLEQHPVLGEGTDHLVEPVADAIGRLANEPPKTEEIAQWAASNVSLNGVASKAVTFITTLGAKR